MENSRAVQRLSAQYDSSTPYEKRVENLERENWRLPRWMEELSILNDVASAVASTWSVGSIVELIVEKCVEHLKVEQGAVWLIEKRTNGAALRTVFRKVRTRQRSSPYRLGEHVIGWMLRHQQPLVINDPANCRSSQSSGAETGIRSLLCVPLRLKGRLIGLLTLFNKIGLEGFSDHDERLLSVIAAQSAQVLENARLYREEQELRLMQQQMRMAQEIQMRLLPKVPPQIVGYDIAGKSTPAYSVGGDYFDFLKLNQAQVGLCLGDVSGKGVSAALLMANVQATIRSQSMLRAAPSQCLRNSSQQLYRSTDSNKFVTMFYGVLDTESGQLQYSNAGHNPPILIPDKGDPKWLTIGGPVLGAFPSSCYKEATVQLMPGDLLLIYSDGFSEAMNGNGEEFGAQRLMGTATKYRRIPAAELIDRIEEDVKNHCGDTLPADDMTMVVVRARGQGPCGNGRAPTYRSGPSKMPP